MMAHEKKCDALVGSVGINVVLSNQKDHDVKGDVWEREISTWRIIPGLVSS